MLLNSTLGYRFMTRKRKSSVKDVLAPKRPRPANNGTSQTSIDKESQASDPLKSSIQNCADVSSSSGLSGDNDDLDLLDVAKRPEGNLK